ncbi:MAG: hypothetical protein A3B91_05290 [Candidatus Yanofskybacteria bacterium RIFCSPHIGHO2_02_FULL_41_29]|uniref:Uncharacterized protein n=1 Tax=Candidatus Yanofskybacteria bacterium RIFCSPHIGHO2_01_FULL_41_53 TaxID=1802663 RepID=A0A1F8EK02_9BACT|nr:MAG: hypothetical protein A2650_05175 [Candidatus Yanofskybacteria bacterium RIFCSPHIGHO2_01_FULL_41_53]OGN12236.1 MAG: hypothetical protein A3B91_05290 [Candidatus Yanofskybacteria bacterium RIFCSPHIGHO2_02_FULL_41_29]OGN17392.1 MAG: hypothetical protein A3F48_02870 [Candidatus Yanofskybacteria bacterium RIFCSPHIGHO2_12_FULL_41_9]OGN23752.1 MAG: hypothetical protein A2916_02860 [Candidatus Yanofskybacteria bacterium RIFCSPLOWO2_01_FULL_41_67]OGN30353.1 MAG: hypothetical protein A3H54_05090 
MKLILTVKNQKEATLKLKEGNLVIDEETLTIGQGFDTLLITAIDNILAESKINKLCLRRFEISGKILPGTVLGMLIKTVKSALEV